MKDLIKLKINIKMKQDYKIKSYKLQIKNTLNLCLTPYMEPLMSPWELPTDQDLTNQNIFLFRKVTYLLIHLNSNYDAVSLQNFVYNNSPQSHGTALY